MKKEADHTPMLEAIAADDAEQRGVRSDQPSKNTTPKWLHLIEVVLVAIACVSLVVALAALTLVGLISALSS